MALCQQQPHMIRNSFDLAWSGVSAAELLGSVSACELSKQQRPHSLQLPRPCQDSLAGQDLLSPSDAAELLVLLQQQGPQQQQQGGVTDDIDAHIQRLIQLKQFLRHSKVHQQEVILEDVACLSAAPPAALDTPASGLFASTGLPAAPLPTERCARLRTALLAAESFPALLEPLWMHGTPR
jgi:hypothetical protein